jgi:hypothetical protein
MKMGLRSAHDVTGLMQGHFEKTFNAKYHEIFQDEPADGIARKVHEQAVQVSSVVYSSIRRCTECRRWRGHGGDSEPAAHR